MASGIYVAGKRAMMGGDVDLINDAIGAALIDLDAYTPDLSEDESLSDVPDAAVLAQTVLTGKALDGTAFRADNAVFASVADEGQTATAVLLYLDEDTYSGSTLIALFDDSTAFPVTPDGTDITVQWDTGAGGIFKL